MTPTYRRIEISLTAARPAPQPAPPADASGPLVVLGIDGAGKSTAIAGLVRQLHEDALPAARLANAAGRRWLSRQAQRHGFTLPPAAHDRFETAVRTVNVVLNTLRSTQSTGLSVMDRHLACQLVLRRVRGLPDGSLLPRLASRSLRGARVVLLDVDAATAYERIIARNDDYETLDYLAASRREYLRLAAEHDWTVLDASRPLADVIAQLRAVAAR